ncbi:MAG TPA: DUF86 domain-containing protein [Solirubrobacterales bacterium]|nr:DUF86 domain-containing protein [Solirubrobacterales bacterium]
MVDPESIEARLSRLGELLAELERIRAEGRPAYDAGLRAHLACQHALQLAIQTCIDIGTHLISEHELEMPSDYRGVFRALEPLGLSAELAERLGSAAGLRNVLVHDYLKVDDDLVWGALENLDDLRDFAGFAATLLD